MRIEEIEQLVELVARSGVSEVTIRSEGRRITVRKAVVLAPPPSPAALVPVPHASGPDDDAVGFPARMEGAESASSDGLHWITAPMVGIFHHAEPPVAVGVRVESGQVVGMIESMKLMNDVCAEENGILRDMQIEAGLAVEYGQPLFGIQTE